MPTRKFWCSSLFDAQKIQQFAIQARCMLVNWCSSSLDAWKINVCVFANWKSQTNFWQNWPFLLNPLWEVYEKGFCYTSTNNLLFCQSHQSRWPFAKISLSLTAYINRHFKGRLGLFFGRKTPLGPLSKGVIQKTLLIGEEAILFMNCPCLLLLF